MSQPSITSSPSRARRAPVLVALLAILGVAAYFRLSDLGLASLRADTITFWNICSQPAVSAGDIFRNWLQLMGISGQFPFPMAFTKGFLDVFNLPVTHVTLRLPSALWGVLSVLFAYAAGRAMGSVWHGLCLALLLALNTFHILVSREAYFYPPLVAGAFLELWVCLWMADHLQNGRPLSKGFFVASAAGLFLLTYSQPTGWPLAGLTALVVVGGIAYSVFKRRDPAAKAITVAASYVVIGLPLLFAHWGLKHLILNASGATKAHALAARAVRDEAVWKMATRVLTSFGWGGTPVRAAFTLLVLLLGLAVIVRRGRRDGRLLLLAGLPVLGFALFLLSRASSGVSLEPRYVVALLPVYLAILTLGVVEGADLLPARFRKPVPLVLAAAAVGLSVYPSWVATKITGKPTPYKDIVAWCDAHLAQGVPVLVDRWFEPWNELKVYPSTNVFFAFTVPNEPVETFKQVNWRDTAKAFFARYPEAAYLEIAKTYWTVPEVGPWTWPREHFARHVAITNEAGLKLRALGLANRDDFYVADTNRLVVDIFYNTTDDVVKKARDEGVRLLVLYGPGWGYTKTQDYRDWRVLRGMGEVSLYNLTDGPLGVRLALRGVSMGGSKMVKSTSGAEHVFPPGQMEEWVIGQAMLPAGRMDIQLVDPLWSSAQNALLVEDLAMQPAAPAPAPAPAVKEGPP